MIYIIQLLQIISSEEKRLFAKIEEFKRKLYPSDSVDNTLFSVDFRESSSLESNHGKHE